VSLHALTDSQMPRCLSVVSDLTVTWTWWHRAAAHDDVRHTDCLTPSDDVSYHTLQLTDSYNVIINVWVRYTCT